MRRAANTNWNIVDQGYTTAGFSDTEPGDEMLGREGHVNPHWQSFIQVLDALGLEAMASHHKEVMRLLQENGVTYVVHGEKQGHRPWELDPIPLIISNRDWETISAGLTQRAELLNLILTDLYGQKRLIKDGLLPPEVAYAHAGFLRPCNDLIPTESHLLLSYAADLARGPDGCMSVLNDRTQAPAGAGYALENRTVLARTLPNLFGEIGVHRLSFFFRALQNSLEEMAPREKDNPHVVVLTPGPFNETYFEHAYLASYLGYTLVQGEDLTVWDGRVWLKSLDGLRPVDIILRRVDDICCDPLELRQDSRLGVAGLLEAIRQGNVVVVNPPGSGVLENPGLIPFLSGIAKQRMGEELRLPSVATWWCGQPKQRAHVLANLKKLVIKTIHRQPGVRPLFGSELSNADLNTLRDKINAKPHLYVGQEHVHFSTTPSLIQGKLEPRRAVLRSFLFAGKDGYAVMPGGLTRCAGANGNQQTVSIQDGGVSKDTWILAPEPEPHISLWQQPKSGMRASVNSQGLSSRSAENLFWVGRYAERAEGHARLLRIMLDKIKTGLEVSPLGLPLPSADNKTVSKKPREESRDIKGNNPVRGGISHSENAYLRSMLHALTGLTSSHPGFVSKEGHWPESELLAITLDTKNSGSLVSTLQSLVRAAYAVRDRWSTDTWRVMNNIENLCSALEKNTPEVASETSDENYSAALDASSHLNSLQGKTKKAESDGQTLQHIQTELDRLMIFLAALSGLNAESMTQTIAWICLDMGRRIERALLLIGLCRSSLVAVQDVWIENLLLESILAAAENLITYRGRYRSELHLPTVLELLLLDESNPRSLVYQLKRLQEQIRDLPREQCGYRLSEEERLILEALTQLQLSNTIHLAERSEHTTQRTGLEKLLARLAHKLVEISDVLTQTYFSHVQGPQQLVATDF